MVLVLWAANPLNMHRIMPPIIDFRRSSLMLLFVLSYIAALSGCHYGPPTARIRGKVHFKDGTIPHGELAIVTFGPQKDSTAQVRKAATGVIDPTDGSFEMNTRKAGDGVNFGDYMVMFNVVKSMKDPKLVIAEKYTEPTSTPYKITVDGDRSDLDYEVEPATGKSAGGNSGAAGGPGPG
jgi:hypothetical protein